MITEDWNRPKTWLHTTLLRYLGPFSPFGPLTGGMWFAAFLMLIATVMGPPVGYLIRHVIRPEIALVSYGLHWWQAVWSA